MERTPDQMERGCRRESAVSTRLLFGRPLDLQLSNHDLTIVLLRSLGPANVSSTVVNNIFEQIDEDKNGLINADELSNFLQAKQHGRFPNFMTKRIVHAPNIGGSMFVCGSSLSILNNLWKRSREATGIMSFASYIIMWLFLIGSALFAGDFVRTTIKRLKDEGVESSLARQLLRKSISSLGQIINLSWLLGSLAYVLAVHSKELTLSSTATSRLWVIGGVCYFFGGLLALPSIYRRTSAKIKQQEEMLQKIHDIIKSKRILSDVSFDSHGTKTCTVQTLSTIRRRSGSESLMQPMHLEPFHRRQSTCPPVIMMDIVLDADKFSQEKLPKVCSIESLKTVDTESLTCSQDDTLSYRRRSDCSLENSTTGSTPSYDDVYASLSSDTDVDVFIHALNGMYAKGQIEKSLHEEFVTKVNNLTVWQEIAMSTGFGIALLYTVAGMLFTIGSIDAGLPEDAVQNMFLAGSCIYLCGGTFSLYQQWKAARSSWNTLQSVVSALQQYTFPDTTTQSDFSCDSCN